MIYHGFHMVNLSPWSLLLSAGLWNLALSGLILLTSGATITLAHHGILQNKHKLAKIAFLITIILALWFTLLQVMEYFDAPFDISDGAYGATFFFATGFHGLHVIIGTIFIIVSYGRFFKFHLLPRGHFGFEAASWYWHFGDVIKLFLINKKNARGYQVSYKSSYNNYVLCTTKHPLKVNLGSQNVNVYTPKRWLTSEATLTVVDSLQIMLKFSILFSLLASFFRVMLFDAFKNIVLFKVSCKIKAFIWYLLSFRLVEPIIFFSLEVTNWYFNKVHDRIFYIVSTISGISIGFSFGFRMLLVLNCELTFIGYLGQAALLFFFGVNALFRSIVSLSLLLTSGPFRHFLESLGSKTRPRNFGNASHFPNPGQDHNSENHDSNDKKKESGNHYHYHYHFYTEKNSHWQKVGHAGAGTAGAMALAAYLRKNQQENAKSDELKKMEELFERQRKNYEIDREGTYVEHKLELQKKEETLQKNASEHTAELEKYASEIKRLKEQLSQKGINIDDIM